MKYLFLLFSLASFKLLAQTWEGTVYNTQGDALPFVNVYFEGSTVGTTTNLKGQFSLEQPNNIASKYLVAQYLGFEKQKIKLDGLNPQQKLKITLKEQSLQEVTIASYKRDPAYYIIKQAQKKRKFHLNQIDSFACQIYLKGTTRLLEKPQKLPGIISISVGDQAKSEIDSLQTGVLYFQESLAKVQYSKKNGFYEEMIASKVSGSPQSFSFNRAQEVMLSFYEDRLRMGVITERGFVSPIASDAMLYYDYKLLGTFEEDGFKINKIEVIPKRETDLIYSGTIFIVEDLWNIHSLDLKVNKRAQIEFVDSLQFKQSYAPLQGKLFLPIALQASYYFSFFGFRANYAVQGSISSYDLNGLTISKPKKNEVFKVQEQANVQDSSYWNRMRPLILDADEAQNLIQGDSLKEIRESKSYLDSLDKINNKIKFRSLLIGSINRQNRFDSTSFSMPGILNTLQYQSVDGVLISLQPRWQKETSKGRINHNANLRWGTASGYLGAQYRYQKLHNYYNRLYHSFELGSNVIQINEEQPASNFVNSLYNLIDGKNYNQFYRKSFFKAELGAEVINGIQVSMKSELALRENVVNNTHYNFRGRRLLFAENQHAVNYLTTGLIPGMNMAFKNNLAIGISFKQRYASYPNRKVNYGSPYPKILVNYQWAWSEDNEAKGGHFWNRLSLCLSDRVRLGAIGTLEYYGEAGSFLGQLAKNFVDYHHFAGNQTVVLRNKSQSFQNLPYYAYSANRHYAEIHVEQHFYGFFINKIPLVRRTKWKETAGINLLWSDTRPYYSEIFAGIDNIFNFFKIQFVSYYIPGQNLKPLLRIGLRIN